MKTTSQILHGVQVAAAFALLLAAVSGHASVDSNGLHIERLAYDGVGFAVVVACLGSLVTASYFLTAFRRSRGRGDVMSCLFSLAIALVAASSFANAPPGFSINGNSPELISWPALAWIAVLLCMLILSACRVDHANH
jgi:hypothetical protein